jgi:dTDP-4-dehydrorhamnose 3,5-epimerase
MTASPKNIPAFNGSIAEAFADAKASNEPRFLAQPLYADDRGYSLMNQLQGVMTPEGQVNYSVQYPGVIKAWHRHSKQTDFWIALRGHIKVGVHDADKDIAWATVIGEHRPGVVIIPPPLWHGAATVGHEPAGLFYFVTHAYDPANPDEERRAYDALPGFPWQVQFR